MICHSRSAKQTKTVGSTIQPLTSTCLNRRRWPALRPKPLSAPSLAEAPRWRHGEARVCWMKMASCWATFAEGGNSATPKLEGGGVGTWILGPCATEVVALRSPCMWLQELCQNHILSAQRLSVGPVSITLVQKKEAVAVESKSNSRVLCRRGMEIDSKLHAILQTSLRATLPWPFPPARATLWAASRRCEHEGPWATGPSFPVANTPRRFHGSSRTDFRRLGGARWELPSVSLSVVRSFVASNNSEKLRDAASMPMPCLTSANSH